MHPRKPLITQDEDATHKKKMKKKRRMAALELNPGDALLSHGETPHYHRRMPVSLLSSRWDQVVPDRYGRQETWFEGPSAVTLALLIEIESHRLYGYASYNPSRLRLYGQDNQPISTS